MLATLDMLEVPQHFVMSGVSWAYYEHTLEQIGNRSIRVAYLDGVMELMSPLPRHDNEKKAIADLVAMLTFERTIARKSYGSTTFRIEEKAAGLRRMKASTFTTSHRLREWTALTRRFIAHRIFGLKWIYSASRFLASRIWPV